MNYYIITFDRHPSADYKTFHEKFVSNPNIIRWFHYIKSSYIIGTTLDASNLSQHFMNTAESLSIKSTHLVIGVDLKVRQGMLPKSAWEWFKKHP